MKKALTAALLAAITINGAALQASEILEEIEVTEESPQMGYFSASVDRLKRCVTGKCTRYEALQAARDVGIAAIATVAGLYAVGAVAGKYERTEALKPWLQAPVAGPTRVGKRLGKALRAKWKGLSGGKSSSDSEI